MRGTLPLLHCCKVELTLPLSSSSQQILCAALVKTTTPLLKAVVDPFLKNYIFVSEILNILEDLNIKKDLGENFHIKQILDSKLF